MEKRRNQKRILVIAAVVFAVRMIFQDGADAESNWSSVAHLVKLSWSDPWERVQATYSKDSERELIQLFVNKKDRISYLLRVTPDVSKSLISDDEFHSLLKEQQITSTESATLIDECRAKLYGLNFYRIRTTSLGTKGKMCVSVYSRRDGDRNWVIQLVFPYTHEEVKNDTLPTVISALKMSIGMTMNERQMTP